MRISVGVLVGIVLLVRRDRPGLSRLSLAPAGGHARCRHQHLRARSCARRPARHRFCALDGLVDLAPGGVSACPTSTPQSESALMTHQRIESDNAFVGGIAGPRVLIVDDHDGFRAVARTLLESEGFDVVGEAADGVEAVRATERLTPALVLLDVHLPDEDGFAVTER